jgi:hypothetical protein
MLALEMVFLAVLFAVVVNIRWRWRWKIAQPLKENPPQEKPLQARDWLSPAGVFTAAVIAVAVLTGRAAISHGSTKSPLRLCTSISLPAAS